MCRAHFYSLLVIICLSVIIGCSSKNTKEPGRYYNDNYSFSIKFPERWDVIEVSNLNITDKNVEAKVQAMGPKISSDDIFDESIAVVVERISPGMSLEDYFDETIKEAQEEDYDFQEDERGDFMINNEKTKWIIFNCKVGEYKYRFLWYCFLKGNRGYIIACNANADEFAQHRNTFESTAESFKLKNK